MPKFFEYLGFWIGAFSNEEDRAHVHVMRFGTEEEMKVWLLPEIEVEYVKNINPKTANKIVEEIRRRKDECEQKWNESRGLCQG